MPHARWKSCPTHTDTTLGDHRRYPGCRFLVQCMLCGWQKDYSPERIIARLHEQRTGGNPTQIRYLARRIGWTCPGCGRAKWRVEFAWPPDMDEREIRRLVNQSRS
jgi:hypothetical protein